MNTKLASNPRTVTKPRSARRKIVHLYHPDSYDIAQQMGLTETRGYCGVWITVDYPPARVDHELVQDTGPKSDDCKNCLRKIGAIK